MRVRAFVSLFLCTTILSIGGPAAAQFTQTVVVTASATPTPEAQTGAPVSVIDSRAALSKNDKIQRERQAEHYFAMGLDLEEREKPEQAAAADRRRCSSAAGTPTSTRSSSMAWR